MPRSSLRRLEQEFVQATPRQQRTFLIRLPQLLDFSPSDMDLLKAAESSFAFWDNPDDSIDDTL